MPKRHRLYGWDCSPFTLKSRACLRYKQMPCDEVVPNFLQMRGVIQRRVGRMVMPILITPDDRTIQDSSLIIDHCEAIAPMPAVIPDARRQRLFSYLMETLADEWLPLPAMHYRWNFPGENRRHMLETFGAALVPGMPKPLQRVAAKPIANKMQAYLPVLGIDQHTIPGVEAWTGKFLDILEAHFSAFDFLLGGAPTLGDFSFYGFLQGHLKQDPYPSGLFETRPFLNAWLERMEWPAQGGSVLADDAIPETLNPLLEMFFDEVFPMLASTEARVAAWCSAHPEATHIKRGLGSHEFSVGGTSGKRTCLAFSQWMLQRPLDCYQTMSSEQRQQVDTWLDSIGGRDAMQMKIRHRLEIRDFRLIVV